MRFNNRAMALAGIPDLPEEAFKHNGDRKIKPQGGGGGAPTQSTSYTSNIPEYMEPYVHKMMSATEGQIYQPGGGFRPYQSYSEYDKKRGGSGETVAGMTPMQSQAMGNLQGYQLPQQGQFGSMMAAGAGLGSMGAGQQYAQQATNPYATQAYMSPYMQNALAPQMREAARQSEMMGQENQAKAAQQGAFGGSRSAIVEAERQRNLGQQQADIYGKGMQSAFEQARQAQQFGADLNLKGMGQGLQGAQALGELGQQQYGQQMGVLGQQLAVGKQQQEYEQNRLNQIIQDYATSQQYPFMQLGMLSNMIRGQPMQAVTTQSYQAQPNFLQQGIGALGMVNSMQGNKKEGGVIKEMASGGIASGLNDYELRGMSKRLGDDQLGKKVNDPSTDPDTKDILGGEMARRSQTRKAAGVGMASGGILAFASGSEGAIKNPFAEEEKDAPAEAKFINASPKKEDKKEAKKEEKKAAPKASTGIMGDSPEFRRQMKEIGPALAERQKVSPYEKTLIDALETENPSKRTAQSFLDERQELYRAAGADPQFFEKAKTPLTKRMAELDSGAENKKRMREAQAWAVFGSTPGPLLSSAMKAYSGYLEQSITDEEDLAKAKSELNKAIFDIDKASYLEKIGDAKDANKFRYDSFDKFTKLSYEVADLAGKRSGDVLKATAGASEKALESRTQREVAYARASGAGGGEDKLKLKENENINKALEAFDKRKEKQIDDLNSKITALPEGHRIRVGAEEGLRKIESERKDLENRLREQMKRGTVSADGAAPKEETRPAGVPADAKKSDDGHWYAPDPNRPGKYLKYT
jgi:hypothetical protein